MKGQTILIWVVGVTLALVITAFIIKGVMSVEGGGIGSTGTTSAGGPAGSTSGGNIFATLLDLFKKDKDDETIPDTEEPPVVVKGKVIVPIDAYRYGFY